MLKWARILILVFIIATSLDISIMLHELNKPPQEDWDIFANAGNNYTIDYFIRFE